jgi:hypothetical protein
VVTFGDRPKEIGFSDATIAGGSMNSKRWMAVALRAASCGRGGSHQPA